MMRGPDGNLVEVAEKALAATDDLVLNLKIPSDLDYFNGHFPEAPILAGVVQLDWAIRLGLEYLRFGSRAVQNLEVLKFQVVLTPGLEVQLFLTKKTSDKFVFSYHSDQGMHASGRVVLGH